MKLYAQRILLATSLGILPFHVGCATSRPVQRVPYDSTYDLSGRWNDTDSQQVAFYVVGKALRNPSLHAFRTSHDGRKPIVMVGTVLNKSQEHIAVATFVKDIQSALINSGQVRFVSSRFERQELRNEREDQQRGYTLEQSQATLGAETGADYMLKGSLESIVDELGGERAIWYQVNLELHDLATNEIAWMGQHKIKKLISRPSVSW